MPGCFAGEFGAAPAAEQSDAFRAGDVVLGLAMAAGNLSLRHERAHAVGPFVIHFDVFARQQKPDCTANPFRFASSAFARTERTPATSVATGFSRKACLPAATAALKCCGRKPGGVVSRTTSRPEPITFS